MRAALAFGLWVLSIAMCGALPSAISAQAAASSDGSEEVARGLFQAGKAAYEAGNFEDALSFFEQAHARSGRPQLLFNVGQAADRLRNDEKAVSAFRKYLVEHPQAENRAYVEARIAALEKEIAEGKAAARKPSVVAQPASTVAPTPAETAARAPSAERSPERAVFTADSDDTPVTQTWWFWTGVGAVVVGGAAVALAMALGGEDVTREPFYEGNGGSLQGP